MEPTSRKNKNFSVSRIQSTQLYGNTAVQGQIECHLLLSESGKKKVTE